MIYISMALKGCTIPNCKLNGIIIVLQVVVSYKYRGHYITDDLSDDEDINSGPAARGDNLAKIPPNQVIADFGRGSSVESESE